MSRSVHRTHGFLAALAVALPAGCSGGGETAGSPGWAGSVDTLPSGQVVVRNPEAGTWSAEGAWTAVEELRIGSFDEPGPFSFGSIVSLDVDAYGRIWVLESQAKEIRVFGADGAHVRTLGGAGAGPGEFGEPSHLEFGPDGNAWVPDPQNGRISVIDTTGAFLTAHPISGGITMSPWPGGFDREGRYYLPAIDFSAERPAVVQVRHDMELNVLDTLPQLSNPDPPEQFELTSPDGRNRMMASVPFGAGLATARSPDGTMFGMMTDDYRLFEVSASGDTLRTILAHYDPLPVTDADREAALEGLSWFTDQGGRVDVSKIPDVKPAANSLFIDQDDRVWVDRITEHPSGRDFDLFDSDGRFMGRLRLPVATSRVRRLVGDRLYAVVLDELGVPYVVRIKIVMPPAG